MLIVPEKTYRGKEGMFIGGHPAEMTKTKLALIQEDCASHKETFKYRVVKENEPINRPTVTQTIVPSMSYRGKEGSYEQGKEYTLPHRKIRAIAADCKDNKVDFKYEVVTKKQQTTPSDKQLHGETETK